MRSQPLARSCTDIGTAVAGGFRKADVGFAKAKVEIDRLIDLGIDAVGALRQLYVIAAEAKALVPLNESKRDTA
jgi:hypothetical protein